MKRVLEQLTAYHTAQGLTGADLSAAVSADADRVRANVTAQGDNPKAYIRAADRLQCLFLWDQSPEGEDYWEARNDAA